jgi:hypothetical protein
MTDLQIQAHDALLKARNIDYFVNTRNFIDAFNVADETQKICLKECIQHGDLSMLYVVVRALIRDCLEAKNIFELREIARYYNVYGATKLNKNQLIQLIKKERSEL